MNFKNIIEELQVNNEQFIKRTGKDFFELFQDKQQPQITIITCSDSRVQIEALADNAFNKFFVIRNIGNQIYSNEGSVDYGILHLKTPILLILAHTDCGAIKAFLGGYDNEPDSIKTELNHLIPAINNDGSPLFKHITNNLNYQVNIAMEKYQEKIIASELMIIGAIYDFQDFLGEGFGKFKITNINSEIQD